MIKKILVALDGSESSYKALDFAIDLAGKYSAEVTLLSVVYVPTISYAVLGPPHNYPESLSRHKEEVKAIYEKMLSDALEKAKKAKPTLKITTKVMEGRPADVIIETAKKEKSSVIVMGSRGLGGVKEFFLGSVSDRVADEASCPVLIIK